MLNNKIIILTIMLVTLLTVSAVSAADNITQDVVSVEETTDEVVSVEENNNQTIDSVGYESDFLSANSEGTFTDLANEIANSTGELKLTRNYVYDSSKDSSYKNGIEINKEITINGKGFVINGDNQARAFNIKYANVTLRNIEFINCSSSNGGAVYWSGSNGSLFDCNFVNVYGSGSGGAVYWSGSNGSLFDCNFVNVHSSGSGGAVYWSGANGTLFDCNYMKCYSSRSSSSSGSTSSCYSYAYGGAVYWNGDDGSLFNCCFEDCNNSNYNSYSHSTSGEYSRSDVSSSGYCYSYAYGGAVYWNKKNGRLFDCDFINCYSYSYSYSSDRVSASWGSRSASSSSSSYSSSYGGAYWHGNNGNLFNCTFINSSSSSASSSNSKSGSDYYYYSSSYYYYYAYSDSYANSYSYGGAVYWNGDDGSLFNCNFITSNPKPGSSNSGSGGAVYWYGNDGNLLNCSFMNCHVPTGGQAHGVYWYGTEGKLFNSSFINSNSSSSNKDSIYWYGTNGNMYNCSFNGNYYDYEKYCSKASNTIVCPVILIHTSTLSDDDRIVIFECTQLANNVSVTLYNVTDRKILYDDFDISSEDLTSSYTVNNLEESEYQIVLEYDGDAFYSSTSTNDLFKIGRNPSYEVSINNVIDVGENVTLNLTLNEDATGKVKLTLSNNTYINELVDGKTSFNIPYIIGEVNEYQIKYVGDDKYNPIYINSTFIVSLKLKPAICLDLKDKYIFDESILLKYSITPNCTGNIGIYVDDVFIDKISVGNVFKLENIDAGEHNVTLIYNGDKYFTTCSDTGVLTVKKAKPSINVNTYYQARGIVFEVILNEKATGKVSLVLNNKKYPGTLIDGKANITVSGLPQGNYAGNVTYGGNNNYISARVTVNVVVNKVDTTISASDITVNYGDVSGKLVATLSDLEGNPIGGSDVAVIINNVEYPLTTDSNGQISVSTADLDAGFYVARINYGGNNNYNPSSITVNVVVNQLATIISAYDVTVNYGDIGGMLVATLSDVNGNPMGDRDVAVILDNAEYPLTTDSNGQISVPIDDLDAGSYATRITYDGDNNYNSSSVTVNVVVNKMLTSVSASDVSVSYGDAGGMLVATLSDVNGNPMANEDMLVILDNAEYPVTTDLNGKVSVSTGDLDAGSYVARIVYDGNNNYYPSTANAKVTVKINVDISTSYDEDTKEVIATLTNSANGMAIGGVDVQVTLNGVTTTVKSNSKGQVKVSAADLPLGTFTAAISYAGSNKYNPANTTMTASVKTDMVISAVYDGANSEIVGTLTNGATGKPVDSAKVNVKLNGVDYALKTNSRGQVKVSTADLPIGTYAATISYDGNSKYRSASTSITFATKVDMAISAVYDMANSKIIATLTNDATGQTVSNVNVNVKVNDVTTTVKSNTKGQAIVSTADLPSGTYTATISYAGNAKYNPASTSITFATKIDMVISGVFDSFNRELVVTLTSGATGNAVANVNVQVNLNAVNYALKTNSKGQVKVSTADLPLGTYTAKITYAGNSKYNSAKASISVDVKTRVIVTDVYGYSNKLVASLTNGATGNAITNANMVVDINGVKTTVKSDSKGQISLDTSKLGLTKYDVTISYAGNSRYTPSSATVAIDLNKANMNIRYSYNENTKELTATLKNSKTGKVVSSANMVVDINGVKTTLKSNNKGQIIFSTADWTSGTHVGTITYGGNDRYNSISAAFKVDV